MYTAALLYYAVLVTLYSVFLPPLALSPSTGTMACEREIPLQEYCLAKKQEEINNQMS